MKSVRITVMTRAEHHDLIEKYENPIEHACDMKIGDIFISHNGEIPEYFCRSAWMSIFMQNNRRSTMSLDEG